MLTPSRQSTIAIILVCLAVTWFSTEHCSFASYSPDDAQGPADIGEYILVWQVAGPYSADQQTGASLLDTPFIPEHAPDSNSILWQDFQIADQVKVGWIDLATLKNKSNDNCAYARTQIWSDVQQEIQLEITTQNNIKIWLNSEVVNLHDKNILRTTLGKGWNNLMLKIAQDDDDWGFACRLLDASGFLLPGVQVDPFARSIAPPSDAMVLFNGKGKSAFRHEDGSDLSWNVEQSELVIEPGTGDAYTIEKFEDFTLHLEFMYPEAGPENTSDGNSGIYIFDTYEVQILNSWGKPVRHNGCGALYRFKAPDVNATYQPGQWQRYDIEFTAARWDEDGQKLAPARITVRHNGVVVHRDIRLTRKTGAGSPERPGGGPIVLQDHGNRVRFRNIWVLPHNSWEGKDAQGFKPLFDGETLDGWRRIGGKAEYFVQDNMIVGETRPNQPNTFLCTKQQYSDYILELEYKVDRELNSGIQIRSWSDSNEDDSRVRGYQVEIDPSDRAWSSGIYEEGRRGWLHKLDNNDYAQHALKPDDWNRLRIVARGDVIRTYLNDVPASILLDGAVRKGFIGLQVHGVGGRTEPLRIRWRDIRLKVID
ncbi:MAG: DUF1080 domain-containing protein [Planctomycetes bacterium]|nr:DUF1080 domain-containing protein [Planctomycetota bacterium]